MAAMDFPSSPTNGQVYGNYVYNAAKGAWQANPVTSEVAVISPTAPSNPKAGDIWYNSDDGCTYVYYYDGDSYQWVASRNDATFSSTLGPRVDALEVGNVNYLINGGFDIWQRNTSFSYSSPTILYTADRWNITNSGGTGTPGFTVSRQAAGTNGAGTQYCLRFQRNASNTATTFGYMAYNIESIDSIQLAGKKITFSFYARCGANYSPSASTLNYRIATGTGTDQNINNTGLTGQVNNDTSAALTTAWQRFTYTITVPTNATQVSVQFWSQFSGTAGAADYYEITGAQVNAGAIATSFHRNANSIQGELAACQRYYWQGGNNSQGHFRSATEARYVTKLPVTMRAVPTVTKLTNAIVGNPTVSDNQTGTGLTSPATNRTNSVDAVSVEVTGLSGGADARASSINNDCIIVSAEI